MRTTDNSDIDREPWLGVEFRHLAALRAIARTGSFRGAADELGYVQSAISQQIAYLEQLVGLRLVERARGNKHVEVTGAGRLLIAHSDAILSRLAAARADLDALSDGELAVVRLGVPQTVAAGMLPPILRRLAVRAPEVEVELTESASETDLAALIRRGRIDLAFISFPLPDDAPLASRQLLSSPYALIAPAGASVPHQPRLHDLARLDLIAHDRFEPVRVHLRSQGLEARVVLRAETIATVEAMVAAELGAAIVPAVALGADHSGLDVIDLGELIPALAIGLCWHRERRLSAAAQAFRATATAACEHDLRLGPREPLRLAG